MIVMATGLKQSCTNVGKNSMPLITRKGLSGKYTGILDADGSFVYGISDECGQSPHYTGTFAKHRDLLETASYLLADANINEDTIEWLVSFSHWNGYSIYHWAGIGATSRKLKDLNLNGLQLVTPMKMNCPPCTEKAFYPATGWRITWPGVQQIWLHNGKHGSAFYSREKTIVLPAPDIEVVDCPEPAMVRWPDLFWEDTWVNRWTIPAAGTHYLREILQVQG